MIIVLLFKGPPADPGNHAFFVTNLARIVRQLSRNVQFIYYFFSF